MRKFEQSRHLNDGPYLTVNKVSKPLQKLTSQHIYWELINPKSKPPSSLDIWMDLFPFLDKLDWSNIFTLVNRVTCEQYLQTFQCKVLYQTLNCKYNLYKWSPRSVQVVMEPMWIVLSITFIGASSLVNFGMNYNPG